MAPIDKSNYAKEEPGHKARKGRLTLILCSKAAEHIGTTNLLQVKESIVCWAIVDKEKFMFVLKMKIVSKRKL
jgi:hypothetical protein